MSSTEPDELRAEFGQFAASVKELGRDVEKLRRALDTLADVETWRSPATRKRCMQVLRDSESFALPQVKSLLDRLAPALAKYRVGLRERFLTDLETALQEEGGSLRRIGDQPPVFEISGLTLTIDFDKEDASLSYAREEVAKLPLDALEVLQAGRTVRDSLQDAWCGAEAFFAALLSAYRARLGREGKPLGERIQLVKLCAELGVEYANRGLWQSKQKGLRPLERVELAFCLDLLARAGKLHQGKHRLELGTATGGSTKDKKQVLFLEAGMGGGQYYLSLRFVNSQEQS